MRTKIDWLNLKRCRWGQIIWYWGWGLILSGLMVGCQASSSPQGLTVNIERVLSGQMIEITNPSQAASLERVRLIGIEAPAFKQQPWADEATKRLDQLISNQPVLLEFDVQDQYCYNNRCNKLAYLWQDQVLLNEQLLKEGKVLASVRSPNIKYAKRFTNAQEWARIMGLGIWNPETPMRQSPEEFRDQK